MNDLPDHQKWLQRNNRTIWWGVVTLVIMPALTVWGTLVWVGVDRYVPPLPEKAGNVQCWFGADGKSVMCAGVRFVRVE